MPFFSPKASPLERLICSPIKPFKAQSTTQKEDGNPVVRANHNISFGDF